MATHSVPVASLTHSWPLVSDLIRSESDRYVTTYGSMLSTDATACPPWTAWDLTAHLATTFDRFVRMLDQARAGNLQPPFARADLHRHNQSLIDGFTADPVSVMLAAIEEFIDRAGDTSELTAHIFGPISVGLQERFHLVELSLHHDDLLSPSGKRYIPPPEVVAAVAPIWKMTLAAIMPKVSEWDESADPWDNVLRASGRPSLGAQ